MRVFPTLAAGALVMSAASARADVTISSDATANVTCSGGVCTPTAADAVLNVSDLENLLAAGNVEVTTTGMGVQANNIKINSALAWTASTALTLDAYKSITIERVVSVEGLAALALTTNDGGSGGSLAFRKKGKVTFSDLASSLTINGTPYTLVNTVEGIAAAIAANPSGNYALAANYDAKQDPVYTSPPVNEGFSGAFDGLGNAISHLTETSRHDYGGMFVGNDVEGVVRNLNLVQVHIHADEVAGGLMSFNLGTVSGSTVSGSVTAEGKDANAGGLVGLNASGGVVSNSSSTGSISTGKKPFGIGGLVGLNAGVLESSFSTGSVITKGEGGWLGGLAGVSDGTISNSYAAGSVTGNDSAVGGLIGDNGEEGMPGSIVDSYSTGPVSDQNGGVVGGFLGLNVDGTIKNSYWDTTSSGTSTGVGEGSSSGATALTTDQFQAGLPHGFHHSIWRENAKINDGFPYLIANQPPKN